MKRWMAVLLAALSLFCGAAAEEMPLEEAAAWLHGRWMLFSGGGLLNMVVEFYEDGTLQEYNYADGDWELEPEDWTLEPDKEPMPYEICAAPDGLYMDGVAYELRVTQEDGTVSCYGLHLLPEDDFDCEAFGVYRDECGGAYCREGQKPRIDYGGWG